MEQARPLLHIGYHKTATTFLQRKVFHDRLAGLLRAASPPMDHEAVSRTFVNVNPFDFDPKVARRRFEPAIERAQNRGLTPVISHERLSGSPFAGGHDSKEIADRLAATFPDARIFAVIREQRSMILSLYKLYIRQGGAMPLADFISTQSVGRGRMPGFDFEFLEYHRLLGYYAKLFGRENILALPYEMLGANPSAFFGRLGEFIGAPPANPDLGKINVSPSPFALSIKRHLNRYLVKDGLNPAPILDVPNANEVLIRLTRRLNRKLPPRSGKLIDDRWRLLIEERVGDRYARSNAHAAEITGLDLREFGYPSA